MCEFRSDHQRLSAIAVYTSGTGRRRMAFVNAITCDFRRLQNSDAGTRLAIAKHGDGLRVVVTLGESEWRLSGIVPGLRICSGFEQPFDDAGRRKIQGS